MLNNTLQMRASSASEELVMLTKQTKIDQLSVNAMGKTIGLGKVWLTGIGISNSSKTENGSTSFGIRKTPPVMLACSHCSSLQAKKFERSLMT